LRGPVVRRDAVQSDIGATAKTQFLRLSRDDSGKPIALETSVVRYRSKDGKILVDLIGAIHVGDPQYYRKLNRQFSQYQSLLYELVAPPQFQIPTRENLRNNGNPIRWLQTAMQQMLRLESQLEWIDYARPNFVHADLSPDELQELMAARGQSVWTIALDALREFSQQAKSDSPPITVSIGSGQDLFSLIGSPVRLKTMLAEQFADLERLEAGLGKSLGRLLINDRNDAALKVLEQQIEQGKTKIGIFYGVAHMPDFERRLVDEFGLKKTQQAWVAAWDFNSAPKTNPLSDTLQFLSEWTRLFGP
jgi:hypothetical protein